MTTQWGPLAGLIGDWTSDYGGIDVSFHNDQGKIGETRYREETSFLPFGPVVTGGHTLYGLDYRTTTWREGADEPLHREVGNWMWDDAHRQVIRCFIVPHATALVAGGTVESGDTSFNIAASVGARSYGILTNHYLDALARITHYDVSITISAESFSYDQTMMIAYANQRGVILHTDRNTLVRRTN